MLISCRGPPGSFFCVRDLRKVLCMSLAEQLGGLTTKLHALIPAGTV
jgi:hypothetical protein